MIPEVREGLLDFPIEPHLSDFQRNNDLVLQLQKLFVYLKYTAKKAYSPDDWVFAYKDETGIVPVNCMVQQVHTLSLSRLSLPFPPSLSLVPTLPLSHSLTLPSSLTPSSFHPSLPICQRNNLTSILTRLLYHSITVPCSYRTRRSSFKCSANV